LSAALTVDGLAESQLVSAVLSKLEPAYREALRRHYVDGEKTSVIACALGTSAATVNLVMDRCRKRARVLYEPSFR
jgi:DNA-directed RNA polymerase specialized sigma24 family protein